jgi:hypothetical protein
MPARATTHTSGNPATWKKNSTPALDARFIALKSKIKRVNRYTKAGIVLSGYAANNDWGDVNYENNARRIQRLPDVFRC